MHWPFIDEQRERTHLGKFFCLTFVAIPTAHLVPVGETLLSSFLPILAKEPNVVPQFPVLHGSELLPGYSDSDKLASVQAVVIRPVQHLTLPEPPAHAGTERNFASPSGWPK